MDNEEVIRKEAVRLYLEGLSPTEIGKCLDRTRQWVYKWINRHKELPNEDWFKSDSNAPKNSYRKTTSEVETAILTIRKELVNEPYHQTGAVNILYRLSSMGIKPPSLATINRIIKRSNIKSENCSKSQKTKEYPGGYINTQQMDLIGPRYLKGGFRYYLYSIIDVDTHYAAVYAVEDKSARSIVPCLIDFWTKFQLPDYLQMDNELSFRGSNKHPRGLGLLLRVALSNGITPIFIPPAEPWRNGVVESFNNNVQKRFLSKIEFSSFDELKTKADEFSCFHNENHRYSVIANKTPNQMIEPVKERSRLSETINLENKIFVEEGVLIFIRFIRGDSKLKLLDAVFELDPQLKYSYVTIQIVLEKFVAVVSRNQTIYHIFYFPMSIP